ncbi:MAG TPA: RNA polymerase sigma-70 factor [Cytophagales bacterium]|nr:RNA polymerase sigma-70 factor [Cytophagales bacterium]
MRVITHSEKDLIQKLKNGDELSFRVIFDKYKNKLYSYALKLTKSEEFAEEVVLDVFLKIWLNRGKINPDLSFNAFLFKITKNASLNFIKKAALDKALKKQLRNYFDEIHNETENAIISADYDRSFNKAIENLPPQQQMVFKMHRVDGKTHAEIADYLKLSKGTVRNYMMLALANVKRYLNVYGDKILLLICLYSGE